jgi:hypothetical protein
MALQFFKKKQEEETREVTPKKIGRPKMIRDDDEPILDDTDEFVEDEPDTEEEYEKPIKSVRNVKPKTVVVRELPMQPMIRYKNDKTGEDIKFITIEEALTRILEKLEE